MTTLKLAWNKRSKTTRMAMVAGAATLIFGSTLVAGVAMAASESPQVMTQYGGHGGMHHMSGGRGGMPGIMNERMENRMFERLDTDKNDEISRAEVDAAREQRQQRMAEMDSDKDGRVSREERRAYFAKEIDARRTEAFSRADTNGDGGVGLDEFKARAADRATDHFARLDQNGDGKLVPGELNSGKPMHDQPSR